MVRGERGGNPCRWLTEFAIGLRSPLSCLGGIVICHPWRWSKSRPGLTGLSAFAADLLSLGTEMLCLSITYFAPAIFPQDLFDLHWSPPKRTCFLASLTDVVPTPAFADEMPVNGVKKLESRSQGINLD